MVAVLPLPAAPARACLHIHGYPGFILPVALLGVLGSPLLCQARDRAGEAVLRRQPAAHQRGGEEGKCYIELFLSSAPKHG